MHNRRGQVEMKGSLSPSQNQIQSQREQRWLLLGEYLFNFTLTTTRGKLNMMMMMTMTIRIMEQSRRDVWRVDKGNCKGGLFHLK